MHDHDEHETMQAFAVAAAAPPESGLAETIKRAKAAGVKLLDIVKALLSNQGDITAIIAAIQALIAKMKPTPPVA